MAPNEFAVPGILHQIVGPNTNELIDKCIASWKVLQPLGFTITIWNDESLEEFISTNYPFALEAFLDARNHAEASDIARYLLVHHTGGYYMDWDIELLHIDRFIELIQKTETGFLLQDPANLTLASEAFSAGRHEPYLLSLVKDIVDLYNRGQRDSMGTPQYSGPFRMRDSLLTSGTRQSLVPIKEAFLYDYTEIRIKPEPPVQRPMIHYWLHTWL